MSVDYEVEWENDGIGSYEYWGSKEFDAGTDYAVVSDYSINDLIEHLSDGSCVSIDASDLIWNKVASSISCKVDSDAEGLEPDTDGQYDCEKDRDADRYD